MSLHPKLTNMHALEWVWPFWSRWQLADTRWAKPLHVAKLTVLWEKEEGLNILGYTEPPGYHEILEFQGLGEYVVYFFHFFILQNMIEVSPKGVCVLVRSNT